MALETKTMLGNNTCPKCGSRMEYRHFIRKTGAILIKQCVVCRHYIVADQE
ncbi:MAG: hypothetical protein ACTSVL_10245 [Promethearchaeota archaeon]